METSKLVVTHQGDAIELDDPTLDLVGVGRNDRRFFTNDSGDSILLVLLQKQQSILKHIQSLI